MQGYRKMQEPKFIGFPTLTIHVFLKYLIAKERKGKGEKIF